MLMSMPEGQSFSTLRKDHDVILKVIDSLEEKIGSFRDNGSIDVAFLRGFLDFGSTFIDKCHHAKEEHCLFPCLEKRGIPRMGGPIGVMLMEHETGRMILRKIRESLENYLEGGQRTVLDEIINLCSDYIQLLRQHIYKENNVLFPLGDNVIDEVDDREVMKCYDQKELPAEVHHSMEELAGRLTAKRY
jgi:hemerythrin-like domain-containing protein